MIYKNIVNLCKSRNIAVSALERETGLGNGTIGRWKTVSPSVDNVKKVADFFGITIDSLMQVMEEKT